MKTKAAILYGPRTSLVIDEIDLEGPKEKEVLVKFMAAGLCHTDLSIINGVFSPAPFPLILGHEGAGIIQEIGAGITRVKAGDHVVMTLMPVCGQCYFCLRQQHHLCADRDKVRGGTMFDGTCRSKKGNQNIYVFSGLGCFSEYNVVNEQSIIPIDPSLPFDRVALLGCSVVTGVGAVINKAKVKPGSSVAVVGVGGVGLNVIQGAVLANAARIIAIDRIDSKLEYAKKFGATNVINSSKEDPVKKVMELTSGIGIDYAFEAIGGMETALTTYKLIRKGGTAVIIGVAGPEANIAISLFELPVMDKNVLGSFMGSGDIRIDLLNLINLYKIGRLKLDELITKRYKLEEINTGFKDMEAGKNARGVILF